MSNHLLSVLLLAASVRLTACSGDDDGDDSGEQGSSEIPMTTANGSVQATVRYTTAGVPHIRGNDLASVAFGAGYVQARANICLIAESIIKVSGERERYFGPGENNANIISDDCHGLYAELALPELRDRCALIGEASVTGDSNGPRSISAG